MTTQLKLTRSERPGAWYAAWAVINLSLGTLLAYPLPLLTAALLIAPSFRLW